LHRDIDPGNATLVLEAQGFGVAEVAVAFKVEEKLVAFGIAIKDPAMVGRFVDEVVPEAVIGAEVWRKLTDDLDVAVTPGPGGEFLILGGSQWTHRVAARGHDRVAGRDT